MKIYKNNIFTIILFSLILLSSAYEGYKLLAKYHTLDKDHLILFYALLSVFAISATFIIIKFKLIITTNRSIIVIYPFQFRFRTFNKNNLNRLGWDNAKFLFLNFRLMSIFTRTGEQINVTDLEFYNFSAFEYEIMKIVPTDRRLRREKEDVAYDQAIFNKPVVELLLILLLTVLAFLVFALIKIQNAKIIVLMVSDSVFLIQMKLLRDYYLKVMKIYSEERFSEKHE
jgi:hypothetical protein